MVERIRLNQAPEGTRVRIRKVESTNAARGRLCALGLIPGAEIDVFSQSGQCRIRVQNACLALCSTLAGCIECEAMGFSLLSSPLLNPVECNSVECGVAMCPAAVPSSAPHSSDTLTGILQTAETREQAKA